MRLLSTFIEKDRKEGEGSLKIGLESIPREKLRQRMQQEACEARDQGNGNIE